MHSVTPTGLITNDNLFFDVEQNRRKEPALDSFVRYLSMPPGPAEGQGFWLDATMENNEQCNLATTDDSPR